MSRHLNDFIVKKLLSQLRRFKFVTTLVLVFKRIKSKDKTKFDNFYSTSNAEIIISESDIESDNYNKYTKIFRKRLRLGY